MPNHFAVPGVARRYAAGRPYVHGIVGGEILRRCGRVAGAVDIGAGTGLSTRALLGCASRVVGVDPSIEMLGAGFRHPRVFYAAGAAEQLPLASRSLELATIGSAFHWCDRYAALAELDRVVRTGGWVGVYDIEFDGLVESPMIIEWLRGDYWSGLPRCRHNEAFDAGSHVRPPFTLVDSLTLHAQVSLALDQLIAFILSQASSINAVSIGAASLEALEARLREGFACHFQRSPSAIARFDLPFSLLRKVA